MLREVHRNPEKKARETGGWGLAKGASKNPRKPSKEYLENTNVESHRRGSEGFMEKHRAQSFRHSFLEIGDNEPAKHLSVVLGRKGWQKLVVS